MYQHTDTSGDTPRAIGPAIFALPDWLLALDPPEPQIRDTAWANLPNQGYWRREITIPPIGPDEVLTDEITGYAPDPDAQVWRGVQGKRPLTQAEKDARRDDLLSAVGEFRYEREMSGVTFAGMAIATDDRSKTMLNGARVKAEADPSYVTRWKISPTERLEVTASQIVAMSDLVLAFVDACFAADETVCGEILAGKITTRDGVRQRIAELLPPDWPNV